MLLEGRSRNINARRRSRSALIFVDLPDNTCVNQRELSLINTCCWRADHEILMHDGGAGVH